MIKYFSQFFVLCLVFLTGYVAGRFYKPKPSKIITTTQTNIVTEQKKEVITQLDIKKDSSTVKLSNYTEKFFNNKGLLVHEITHIENLVANSTRTDVQSQINQTYLVKTSQINTTTTQEYRSTLFLGLGIPANDLKKPENIIRNFEDINLVAEYRPWDKISLIGEVNYKLTTMLAFTYAVN